MVRFVRYSILTITVRPSWAGVDLDFCLCVVAAVVVHYLYFWY